MSNMDGSKLTIAPEDEKNWAEIGSLKKQLAEKENRIKILENPSDGRCMEIGVLREKVKEQSAEIEALRLKDKSITDVVRPLQQEIERLQWFANSINKYVCPGEMDTQDAALKLFTEQRALLVSCRAHLNSYQLMPKDLFAIHTNKLNEKLTAHLEKGGIGCR